MDACFSVISGPYTISKIEERPFFQVLHGIVTTSNTLLLERTSRPSEGGSSMSCPCMKRFFNGS